MTDDDIRAHVMKAEGVLDQIQDKVTSQFGDARKAIMAIDRAYSQLLSSRAFYREARNELITDRDHWEHEAKEAQRNFRSMQSQSNQLRDEVLEQSQIIGDLKAENAELRAGQGSWPDDGPGPYSGFYKSDEDAPTSDDDHRDAVVTAETIRASEPGSTWDTGGGSIVEFDGEHFRRHAWDGKLSDVEHDIEEVLSHWKLTRSTAAPRGDYSTTPRLTVHALNTAPVGSNVSTPNKTWTKNHDGTWFRVTRFGQHTRASEELLAAGYTNATLAHPGGCGNE